MTKKELEKNVEKYLAGNFRSASTDNLNDYLRDELIAILINANKDSKALRKHAAITLNWIMLLKENSTKKSEKEHSKVIMNRFDKLLKLADLEEW